MSDYPLTHPDEVDHLLRNAQLRDELEPFSDESMQTLNMRRVPTPIENEFLASMLAWEQAPILPIYRWFDPELRVPRPDLLSDASLESILWAVIRKLHQKRIAGGDEPFVPVNYQPLSKALSAEPKAPTPGAPPPAGF